MHNPDYGVTLIIGPFNYPFQLVIAPLIGAISAGNTAIIKPSENSRNIALLLEKLINENFPEEYLAISDGKRDLVISHWSNLPSGYC